MSTSVPQVRAALVERIGALTDLPVTYGHPGQTVPKKFVAVREAQDRISRAQHTYPLKRSGSRNEDYTLLVTIWISKGSHNQQAQQSVTEEAWALADLIDDDLRRDTTLSNLVDWCLVQDFEDHDFLLQEGRGCELVLYVNVHVNRS